jgi:hypothetical protein
MLYGHGFDPTAENLMLLFQAVQRTVHSAYNGLCVIFGDD